MKSENVMCLGALFIFFLVIAWILMRNERYTMSQRELDAITANIGKDFTWDMSAFNENSVTNMTKNKITVPDNSPVIVNRLTLSDAAKAAATSKDIQVSSDSRFLNDIITSIVPTDYATATPFYSADDIGELYKLGQEALKVGKMTADYKKFLFKYQIVQKGVPDLYSPWRNLKPGLTKDVIGFLLGQAPTSVLVPPPPPTTAPPAAPTVAIFPKIFKEGAYSCVRKGTTLVCTST
jgi:hypothetical protein